MPIPRLAKGVLPGFIPSGDPNRYMIASNRFATGTDFGTNDTAYNATDATGQLGGNGTTSFKYARVRMFFTTGAWAPIGGRLLWANWCNSVYGMLPGKFNIFMQRAEVRDMALNLVDTIKWAGAATKQITPGEMPWNDPIASLQANTSYYLDFWYYADDHGSWPGYTGTQLAGEYCSRGNVDQSTLDMPVGTIGTGTPLGGNFGPCIFAARGWDASPCVLITGDSIEDYTAPSPSLATVRGDLGFIKEAMGSTTGGIWNWMSMSRYSSNITSLYTDAYSGHADSLNLFTWLSNATQGLQTMPLFNLLINEHGRNSFGTNETLAAGKILYNAAFTKFRSVFPGIKVAQTSIDPYTTANNNTAFTSSDQTAVGTVNSNAGALKSINDWLLSGADGQIAFPIDTAATVRDASNYQNWAIAAPPWAYSGNLLDAVTANSVNVVRLDNSPPIGASLVFEPGAANVEAIAATRVFTVIDVQPAAPSGYNVTLNGGRSTVWKPATAQQGSRIAKAHAAGIAVSASLTGEGLHGGHAANQMKKDPIINAKVAIRAGL